QHPVAYWRHLSALAIAFQHLAEPPDLPRLVPVLIDALHSDQFIEGSGFSVAGGSLASLNEIAGKWFMPDGRSIEAFNLSWAFPPPIVPFPLAPAALDDASRARVFANVESWWAEKGH